MRTHLIAYAGSLIAFLAIDYLWLTRVALDFYRSRIGELLLERPNLAVAGLFYLFYVVGVVVFAVGPALKAGDWRLALAYGALFGLIAYGTYDITNLATLKGWSPTVAVVDILWGGVLTATSALAGYAAVKLAG
ncbi:MAG: DUF2177 family protein [Alphaproteobacteria bacterium]|nr:DUF2177 family protein [Alphaproteobacteria bacterium]